jgi:hypothetical protein
MAGMELGTAAARGKGRVPATTGGVLDDAMTTPTSQRDYDGDEGETGEGRLDESARGEVHQDNSSLSAADERTAGNQL